LELQIILSNIIVKLIINSKTYRKMKKTIFSLALVAALMTSCKEKTQDEAAQAADAVETEMTEAMDTAAAAMDSAATEVKDAAKDAAAAGAEKVEEAAKAVKEEVKK
jgi:hypothetical protein